MILRLTFKSNGTAATGWRTQGTAVACVIIAIINLDAAEESVAKHVGSQMIGAFPPYLRYDDVRWLLVSLVPPHLADPKGPRRRQSTEEESELRLGAQWRLQLYNDMVDRARDQRLLGQHQ
jgi:hypothetical protein